MSRTLREQRVGYDNIAVGSASGTERTIRGAAPPSETYGGRDNFAVGTTARDPDNLAVGETANPALERVQR
jgi:hypothetical protein